MVRVIDCKKIADSWLKELADRVERMGLHPKLTIVSIGEPDGRSQAYIRSKVRACHSVGVDVKHVIMDADTPNYKIIMDINELSKKTDGLIVQLPLATDGLDEEEISYAILPEADVDCMSVENRGALYNGSAVFLPATVKGVMRIFKHENISLDGKEACIIGRSNIVGKALALAMTKDNATVTLCHSHSQRLYEHTKTADIVVSAVGKPRLIVPETVNWGALLIDVGITEIAPKKLVGDFAPVSEFNEYNPYNQNVITPVPGGVGLLTVAGLVANVIKACEMKL